jgi:hypothetical protein
MLIDVVSAQPLDDHQVHLVFEDGVEGKIDIADFVDFTGVFAPVADETYFRQVAVNPDIGTICWPNGADIDPDVLYHAVTGEHLPKFLLQTE